jgi:hypothetical protein
MLHDVEQYHEKVAIFSSMLLLLLMVLVSNQPAGNAGYTTNSASQSIAARPTT